MENNAAFYQGEWLRKILYTLKKNIWLMLVVIVAFTAVGLGYAYTRKPVYTVQNKIVFATRINTGGESYYSTSLTNSSLNTVVDFCNENCVADRASFYYYDFVQKQAATPTLKVSEYVESLINETTDSYEAYCNSMADKNRNEYPSYGMIVSGKIAVRGISGDDGKNFTIFIGYSDEDVQVARNKTSILVAAAEKEANRVDKNTGNNVYFKGYQVILEDFKLDSISSDVSLKKIVGFFVLLGVVAALIIVYLVTLFNKTITSSEELEMITGASVLAYVDKEEVK